MIPVISISFGILCAALYWIENRKDGAGSSLPTLLRPRGYSPYAGSSGPAKTDESSK